MPTLTEMPMNALVHTGWRVTARGPATVDDGVWVRIDVDTITGRRLGAAGPRTGGRP